MADPGVDPQTGLVYLRARYYDPATAEFLTRDPLEQLTRQPYSYANDNPINNTDPSGLATTYDCVGPACVPAPPVVGGSSGGLGGALVSAGSDFVNTEAQFWGNTVPCFVGGIFGDGCGGATSTAASPSELACPGAFQDPFGPIVAASQSLPINGVPNSTDVLDRGNGSGQIRDYGPNGLPSKDFDFGHDHGAGDPHAHDWIGGIRQPGRPIGPGE